MRYLALIGGIVLLALNSSQALAAESKSFNKWSVFCNVDRLDDSKFCSLKQRIEVSALLKKARVTLSILKSPKNSQLQLMLFSDLFHWREPVYIRIDKNHAHSMQNSAKNDGGLLFPNAQAIISEMRQGKSMFVRFTDKTNATYDVDFDLQSFNPALDHLMSIQD